MNLKGAAFSMQAYVLMSASQIPTHAFLLQTSSLHHAILTILDMSLSFSDGFMTFTGNTSHDISQLSLVTRRHRSRRQKRQRKDVIGFTDSLRAGDYISDSDTDLDEGDVPQEHDPSFSYSLAAPSATDDEFLSHID